MRRRSCACLRAWWPAATCTAGASRCTGAPPRPPRWPRPSWSTRRATPRAACMWPCPCSPRPVRRPRLLVRCQRSLPSACQCQQRRVFGGPRCVAAPCGTGKAAAWPFQVACLPQLHEQCRKGAGEGVPAELREALGGAALAVWTTTAWTLPANLAVAVNERLRYVLVEAEVRCHPTQPAAQPWSLSSRRRRGVSSRSSRDGALYVSVLGVTQ